MVAWYTWHINHIIPHKDNNQDISTCIRIHIKACFQINQYDQSMFSHQINVKILPLHEVWVHSGDLWFTRIGLGYLNPFLLFSPPILKARSPWMVNDPFFPLSGWPIGGLLPIRLNSRHMIMATVSIMP